MSAGGFFLYGMSNAGAARLFQHLFPTPLEKAQLRSLNEQIDIARERLISEEARALREIEVRRELLEAQLSHQQDLQDQRIVADRELRGFQKQLDGWPLSATASSILGASRRRQIPTLNVIVKVRAQEKADLLAALLGAARDLDISARQFFGNDVLIYGEEPPVGSPALLARSNALWGQSLVTAVNDLLYTEPTAFLELCVDGNEIVIDGAFWGWPCEPDAERTVAHRTPKPLRIALNDDAKLVRQHVLQALLLTIAGMQDAFSLLNRWSRSESLRLFDVMKAMGDGASLLWPNGEQPVLELRRLIETLASYAPTLASEAAARAAMDARAAGLQDYAELFLDDALAHARAAIRDLPPEEDAFVEALMCQPPAKRTILQEALSTVREIGFGPEPQPPARPRLSDLSTRANRRVQSGAAQ